MSQSLISVIVPVYNVKEYLNTCVESILNQTHENLEVILVDDGSTDGSGEICDSYAKTDTRVQAARMHPLRSRKRRRASAKCPVLIPRHTRRTLPCHQRQKERSVIRAVIQK